MHARSITPSSNKIISNLQGSVESLFKEIQILQSSAIDIHDADSLEAVEIALHKRATKLADIISAIKIQEALNNNKLNEAEKDLLKSHPGKMKNMGRRTVTIRMLGGTLVTIEGTAKNRP